MTPEKILRNLDHGYTMTHQEQAEAAQYIRQLQQEIEALKEAAYGLPTIEDASQNWAKVDSAVAWHLIERHADNWADVGKMMDEFVAAHVHLEREACAKLCDELAMQVGNKNFIAVDQRKFCAKQIRAKGNHGQD